MKISEDSKLIKFVKQYDKIVGGLVENIGGIMIAFIFLMVLYCVLCRYVLHTSTGGYDEFNTYFLSLVIWAGVVTTSRKFENGHINIDLVSPWIKSEKIKGFMKCLWQIVAITTSVIFARCSFNLMMYYHQRNKMMSGVRFPMWVFICVLFIFAVLLVIYECIYIIALIFGKIGGVLPYDPNGFIKKEVSAPQPRNEAIETETDNKEKDEVI